MLFLKICLTIHFLVLPCYSRSVITEKYHSNHPPLEESYYAPISIPVAIVYDGKEGAAVPTTERSITTYHPRFIEVETTQTDIEETTHLIPVTTTRKNSVNSENRPLKGRAQITQELQIPVQVIYDPVTDKNIKRNILTEEAKKTKLTQTRGNIRHGGRTLKPAESSVSLTTLSPKISESLIEKEVEEITTGTPEVLEIKKRPIQSRAKVATQTEKPKLTTEESDPNLPTTVSPLAVKSTTVRSQNEDTIKNINKDVSNTPSPLVIPPKIHTDRMRANIDKQTENSTTETINPIKTTTETTVKETKTNEDRMVKATKPTPSTTTTLDQSEVSSTTMPRRMKDPVVPIVESQNYVYAQNGAFHYSYEGGDGTKNFENGELKSFDDDVTGEAVSGGFSYKDKDGNNISLTYTADENGYRPVGAHLPTPPPIPPAIARALKYLATKTPEPEIVTESLSN